MSKHVRYVENLNGDDGSSITVGEFRAHLDPSGQHLGLLIKGNPDASVVVGARGPMVARVLQALERAGLLHRESIFQALGIVDEEPPGS